MKTVAEIDCDGQVVRIFHRTPTAAWTHAPGETYRYAGGRHGMGEVTMRCACRDPKPARARKALRFAKDGGRAPGPSPAARKTS